MQLCQKCNIQDKFYRLLFVKVVCFQRNRRLFNYFLRSHSTSWSGFFSVKGGTDMSHCNVIAIANQKGGTGKNTITINLGIGLVN